MIEIKDLTKDFGTVRAIDHLNITLDKGVIGLVGHNGAGKSTLLRLISGIYRANEGVAMVDGFDSDTKEAKAKTFYLSDDPYTPRGANIKESLDFYLGLFDIDLDEFNRLIELFSLPKDRPVSTFSKGMRRQMFVALALSMKADHLLLDEAFDGLDPMVVESIKGEIIKAAEKGKVIVISSHNIYALQRLADRFLILNRGKLAKEGESVDMGTEFVKYQAAFTSEITSKNIAELGLKVISFRKIGSVYNFVVLAEGYAEERIKEKYHPVFLETVALDPDEIVTLEMMLAKSEGGEKDA